MKWITLSLALLVSFGSSYCMDTNQSSDGQDMQQLFDQKEPLVEQGPQAYPPEKIYRINSRGKPVFVEGKERDNSKLWRVQGGNQIKPKTTHSTVAEHCTWSKNDAGKWDKKTVAPKKISQAERIKLTYEEIVQKTAFCSAWLSHLDEQASQLEELKMCARFTDNNRQAMLAIANERSKEIENSRLNTNLKLAKLQQQLQTQIPKEMIKLDKKLLEKLSESVEIAQNYQTKKQNKQEKEAENIKKGNEAARAGLKKREESIPLLKKFW